MGRDILLLPLFKNAYSAFHFLFASFTFSFTVNCAILCVVGVEQHTYIKCAYVRFNVDLYIHIQIHMHERNEEIAVIHVCFHAIPNTHPCCTMIQYTTQSAYVPWVN